MKKIIISFFATIFLFGFFTHPVKAASFFDNFDDGNTDGWMLGCSVHTPWVCGNWRVENGTLVNDMGGDGFIALVENQQYSSQIIEAKFKTNEIGYAGLIFWFKDNDNWATASIYPTVGQLGVSVNINGTTQGFTKFGVFPRNDNLWHDLKVEANSITGDLKVFLDDEYQFTYTAITLQRTGPSGVFTGNAGGYIDDFKLIDLSYPIQKEECKNNSWETFNNPVFKNQGDCVSFIQSSIKAKGNKR